VTNLPYGGDGGGGYGGGDKSGGDGGGGVVRRNHRRVLNVYRYIDVYVYTYLNRNQSKILTKLHTGKARRTASSALPQGAANPASRSGTGLVAVISELIS